MPKSIGEFFNELAVKAGVTIDNEDLKSVLSAPDLVKITIPDELVTQMDSSLINIESAKNNHPDIRKKYTAEIYDALDKHISTLVDTSEVFTPQDAEKLKSIHSTWDRIALIVNALKAAKTKASEPQDKKEINKQLEELHEAVRTAKAEKETTVKDYEGKIKDIRKQSVLVGLMNNYKTIYDDLPSDVKNITLEAIINKALQDNDAVLDVSDNGTLNLLRKDGSNVFGSDHRQHTPQSFLDKTLAPILKVSSPPKQPDGVPNHQQPAVSGTTENASLDFIRSHNQKALAEMESSPVQIM